jgi:hypothetical protein
MPRPGESSPARGMTERRETIVDSNKGSERVLCNRGEPEKHRLGVINMLREA